MAVVTPTPTRARRATTAVVVGSGVLAAAVVFRNLGTKPLWLDEAVSVSVSRRSLPHLLAVLPHQDANAGLYYLVLHGWLRVGHGAAWVRTPSALAFVATAALAAWVACRWRGPWLGIAAALLIASNRFLVFYGQEARPYAIAVLLAVASMAALIGDGEHPAAGAYIAATIGLLYCDLFAVLFAAAAAAALVVHLRRRGRPVPTALRSSWIAIAVAALPLVAVLLVREHGQISWIPTPTVADLRAAIAEMGNGWVGLAAMVALGAVGWAATRDHPAPAVLAAAFVVPPLALWLAAHVTPVFLDRYVICSTLGVVGLAAVGADAVRARVGPVVAAAILVVPVVVGARHVAALERAPYKYEDPPAVIALVNGAARPGDALGFGGGGLRIVIDAYVRSGDPLPTDVARGAGAGQGAYAAEVDPATLRRRLASVDRLWLITDPTDRRFPSAGPWASLRSEVAADFSVQSANTTPGIDVTLYVRRAPA